MKNKLSLDRTQLKLIAIISMVIDHAAWGFLDFYTPLAQFLHVCGRFTVPIMCFFIAEGFRKTSDLKRYIMRMATFAVITVVPFYVFFHEEYDYRQNIIFDLLLGLLMLTVLENHKLKRVYKVVLVAALFVISATIGGWIITPQLFILAFYYGRNFREKAKWVIITDVTMVALLAVTIALNQVYHFSKYDWVWWDKFYLLGFMLALPLLARYNGEKGKNIGKYFFYIFYPAHFLVLTGIKLWISGVITPYRAYLGLHCLLAVGLIGLISAALTARPSKGQNAILFFLVSAQIYILGFIIEILAVTAEGYYLACIVQYFGEYLTFIAVIVFVSQVCRVHFPEVIYAINIVVSCILMYMLITTRETGLFYTFIGVNDSGVFSRPELVHSTGFVLSVVYIISMCTEVVIMCIHTSRNGTLLDKKRVKYIYYSILFCWLPYVATLSGLTGGYEIPGVGMGIAGVCLYMAFFKYGMIDSIALASENALENSEEGVLVLDNRYRILFHNRLIDDVFGDIPHNIDIRKNELMGKILSETIDSITVEDRIYEFRLEPLMEKGFVQGNMLWVLDATEHRRNLEKMSDAANRDGLTGLYNRTFFKKLVDEDVSAGREGCFIMIDMDNFKQVNDHYGHQRGDQVLQSLAALLKQYAEEEVYSCRVGGDEFCVYFRNSIVPDYISAQMSEIMKTFDRTFREDDSIKCTLSIGAYMNDKSKGPLVDCSTMYSLADDKLYEAKNSGKNTLKM